MRLLLRVPVPWVFALAFLLGVGLQVSSPLSLRLPPALRAGWIVGIVLFLTGAAFATWSLLIFRKARTTTVPGVTSALLVTWGPYRLSRNPMYVSLTLAYLGEAGLLAQAWPLLLLPLVLVYVNWVVIPLEETRLKEAFGERYAEYSARVRRWL